MAKHPLFANSSPSEQDAATEVCLRQCESVIPGDIHLFLFDRQRCTLLGDLIDWQRPALSISGQ